MIAKLKCMVIEDEPLAQNVLKNYIDSHPALSLTAVCNDAFEAQAALSTETVDLLFLDINLPGLSGINFLKSLPSPPLVIFTTAYPEYAVQGFDLDAVDYLLKPFSLERFLKAVNKAISLRRTNAGDKSSSSPGVIFLKADKKTFRVAIDDILHLEAMGDYVRVTTKEQSYLINDTLRDLLDQLPQQAFIRVHKSFAIAKNKISFLEGNYIRVGEKDIPIGATYKEAVASELK
ncbi:MAG: LytR/AlgR family response regulator transcription factor [Candidatus Dadabacteria bacterium]